MCLTYSYVQDAAALQAELAEVRRRWADSRDAFAARAVADRDQIERLTHTVNEQEQALLQHFQVQFEAAYAALVWMQARARSDRLLLLDADSCW